MSKSEKIDQELLRELYATEDYLDAYRKHTDLRVRNNPALAVGGLWDQLGELQVAFLRRRGLAPGHSLFDIGCGTLRAGRLFISYLDAGHYTGLELSPEALAAARRLVVEEGLQQKRPTLLLNEGKHLRLGEHAPGPFDYLLAHSVFTHLHDEHITECFENLGSVMTNNSKFYFTFNSEPRPGKLKDFAQPLSFYEALAARNDFQLRELTKEYGHPRGQRMLEVTRAA